MIRDYKTKPASDKREATKRWIENASDELAVRNGCQFFEECGQHFERFCSSRLCLYEGRNAGEPLKLMPWQHNAFMRLFGWLRFDDEIGRWVRRFTSSTMFLPKKSGKSPSAAAVGLYLLYADGEPGQKVYSAAKDYKQAAIVHKHAQMMVEQSPQLSKQCRVNRSTGTIHCDHNRGEYQIVSGENVRGQEGLNGSIIIDEIHVVDRKLVKALKYAGASRDEPLFFEISTAGDDGQSYAKNRWDYGEDVTSGTVQDDSHLSVIYAAPQDASDDDLVKPKTWRLANPSLGTTLREREFRASLDEAKRTTNDWLTFKQYRFNIWKNSSNPWLDPETWEKNKRAFTMEDLRGQVCFGGLDLSKTMDMTAFVLAFPDDGESFKLLPFFFLPEDTAKDQNQLVPFLDWHKQGLLTLTSGSVVDYTVVFNKIVELNEMFDIREIAYDRTYAEELTQSVEMRTGITRVVFPQTLMQFAGPTAEFERLLLDESLHHNGHKVLSWQAGHVQVKTDVNGNKRPVKPEFGDVKKIDGIVAAIMALSRAVANPQMTGDLLYY